MARPIAGGRFSVLLVVLALAASLLPANAEAQQAGSYLIEPLPGDSSAASIELEDTSSFSTSGGWAVIDPGLTSEERIAYQAIDGPRLAGLVRSAPTSHDQGAFIAPEPEGNSSPSPEPSPSTAEGPSDPDGSTSSEPEAGQQDPQTNGAGELPECDDITPRCQELIDDVLGTIDAAELLELLLNLLEGIPDPTELCGSQGYDCQLLLDQLLDDVPDPDQLCAPQSLCDQVVADLLDAIGDPTRLCESFSGGRDCLTFVQDLSDLVDVGDVVALIERTIEDLPDPQDLCNPNEGVDCQGISDLIFDFIETVCVDAESCQQKVIDTVVPLIGAVCGSDDLLTCLLRTVGVTDPEEDLEEFCEDYWGCQPTQEDLCDYLNMTACSPDYLVQQVEEMIEIACNALQGGSTGTGFARCVNAVVGLIHDVMEDRCGSTEPEVCLRILVQEINALIHKVCDEAVTGNGGGEGLDLCVSKAIDLVYDVMIIACGSIDPQDCVETLVQEINALIHKVCDEAVVGDGSAEGIELCINKVLDLIKDAMVAVCGATQAEPCLENLTDEIERRLCEANIYCEPPTVEEVCVAAGIPGCDLVAFLDTLVQAIKCQLSADCDPSLDEVCARVGSPDCDIQVLVDELVRTIKCLLWSDCQVPTMQELCDELGESNCDPLLLIKEKLDDIRRLCDPLIFPDGGSCDDIIERQLDEYAPCSIWGLLCLSPSEECQAENLTFVSDCPIDPPSVLPTPLPTPTNVPSPGTSPPPVLDLVPHQCKSLAITQLQNCAEVLVYTATQQTLPYVCYETTDSDFGPFLPCAPDPLPIPPEAVDFDLTEKDDSDFDSDSSCSSGRQLEKGEMIVDLASDGDFEDDEAPVGVADRYVDHEDFDSGYQRKITENGLQHQAIDAGNSRKPGATKPGGDVSVYRRSGAAAVGEFKADPHQWYRADVTARIVEDGGETEEGDFRGRLKIEAWDRCGSNPTGQIREFFVDVHAPDTLENLEIPLIRLPAKTDVVKVTFRSRQQWGSQGNGPWGATNLARLAFARCYEPTAFQQEKDICPLQDDSEIRVPSIEVLDVSDG